MTTTLFPSAARDAAAYTSTPISSSGRDNARIVTDVTAVSGAGTVTVKLQAYDSLSNKWYDMASAASGAIGTVTTSCLTVGSDIATSVANVNVGVPLAPLMRAIATVATSTVTFSTSIHLI